MAQDHVISFDINAAAVAQNSAKRPVQATVDAGSRYSQKVINRGELAAIYAGVVGVDLAKADLIEQVQRAVDQSGQAPGLNETGQALRAMGLSVRIAALKTVPSAGWPALAEMQNGQVVLILEMGETGPIVYDPSLYDHRAEVLIADFMSVYNGRLLYAQPALQYLARTYQAQKPGHWFWHEFTHYRKSFVEISTASLVANIFAVSISLFSMQVYDRVIPYQSEPTLWVLAFGVLLALILEAVLKVTRAGLMDYTGKKVELAVQERLMQRLLGMKLNPHSRKPSEVFAAMRDFGSVREFFTSATVGTLADLPFLIVFLVLVASIGGSLVWVLVLGGILMVLPGILLQKRMLKLSNSSQGASVHAAKLLYETVFEHETVATQRGGARVEQKWAHLINLSAQASSQQRHLSTLISTWSGAVQQATYVVAVVVGTYLVFAGSFTVGTIIAIGLLTGRTLGPLAQISTMLARWSQVKVSLTALEMVANAPQDFDQNRQYLRRDRLLGHFELRNLEFRYDPKAAATVEIAAMAIPKGQHIAILGANGSGKSTLLRLLAGLYDPSQGRVLIDGVDLAQVHPRDLRRGIGYLSQDVRLFSGTIRDNLNMALLERDDDRLYAALDFAGLGPFVRNHPRGLDLEIRELGEGLSVGQRQSIGWARLWLQDPQVVLLDEPTAALDQTLETTLVSRLHSWLEGRTAIIATHRVPILQLTTRTLILQNGRLAVDGPKDAVLAHLARAQGGGANA